MRFSVLLLRPEYMTYSYGHDTPLLHVDGASATEALSNAQDEAFRIDEGAAEREDYFPLLVAKGRIYDLPTRFEQ